MRSSASLAAPALHAREARQAGRLIRGSLRCTHPTRAVFSSVVFLFFISALSFRVFVVPSCDNIISWARGALLYFGTHSIHRRVAALPRLQPWRLLPFRSIVCLPAVFLFPLSCAAGVLFLFFYDVMCVSERSRCVVVPPGKVASGGIVQMRIVRAAALFRAFLFYRVAARCSGAAASRRPIR